MAGIFAAVAAGAALFGLARFATADADLGLLFKCVRSARAAHGPHMQRRAASL
jgi:hypothetical protein